MVYDVSSEDGEPRPDLLRRLEHRVCEGTGGVAGAHAEGKGGRRDVLGALTAEVPTAEGLIATRFGVDLRSISEAFTNVDATCHV